MICNCALKYSKLLQINMVKSLLFGICQFLHDLDFHLFGRNRKSYLFHILEVEPSSFLIPEQRKTVKPKEKHKKENGILLKQKAL